MIQSNTCWWRRQPPSGSLQPTLVQPQARQQSSLLAFRSLLLFSFILLLAPQEWFPVLAPLRIALLAAGAAMAAHAASRWSQQRPLIDVTPALVAVGWLLAWAVFTLPFSRWPGGSLDYLLNNYAKTLILLLLLAHVVDSSARLKTLCFALVLMAVPLALTTLQHYMAGASFRTGSERVSGYSSALTANPNDMALTLNLILPLCVALFVAARRPAVRLLLGTVFMLLVLAIVATFSRAGFLTLAVSCLYYLWLLRHRPERRHGLALLLLMLLALPLVPASYVDRLKTIVSIQQDASNSAQTRLGDIGAALDLTLRHPLVGAGIGMNALALNEARGTTWTEVHNVYLQLAVELGLPGLALFLLFYARCLLTLRAVLQALRHQMTGTLYCLAEGIKVSLMAFAVAAMFHPVAYHFYFYYMAGLALATQRIRLAGESRI